MHDCDAAPKEKDYQDPNERRGYFRIEDDVLLSFQTVAPEVWEKLADKSSNSETNSFNLKAKFAAIDQAIKPVRCRLRQQSEDLAGCLEAIDQKLEMLAELLLRQENDLDNLPTRKVNLSAGGISFHVQKPVKSDDILRLRLLLLPSHIGIETYARVVYCVQVENFRVGRFPYKVGVEFCHLRESDTDLIIRHVLDKQTRERRAAHQRAQSNDA